MKLSEATLQPVLATWSAARRPIWSPNETKDVRDSLIALSELVLPHLVEDTPFSDAEAQRFLLRRTTSSIENWLTRIAWSLRNSLRMYSERRRSDGSWALGLRSATHEELERLPGISDKRARDLARMLALQTDIRSIEELDVVEGIGPKTLGQLAEQTYLDDPTVTLVSGALIAFAQRPTVENFLSLLDESGLEVAFGDGTTLARHPPTGGAPVARFLRLLDQIRREATSRLSPASGVLASDAVSLLSRHGLREQCFQELNAVDGALLISGDYSKDVSERLTKATGDIRMMMFVATAGEGDAGPLPIIEAMEARAAAGVLVRVILDRDEADAPYKSEIINRPLVKRLRNAGITVKLDTSSVLLHSKFFVVDEAAVVIGSHNLTKASMIDTHEVSVLLEGRVLARIFAQRFDALWTNLP